MQIPSPSKRAGNGAPKVVETVSTQSFEFKRPQAQSSRPTQSSLPPSHPDYRPQKPASETSAEFFSVDLPSNFQLYPFKTLSVSPLKGIHIAKFNRAFKEERLKYIVEAISSTLGDGVSAFDLQPGDFYYLMYWHRVNSFPKNPMMIEAYCQDLTHNLQVTEGVDDGTGNIIKKEKETLHIKELLNNTTLETKNLKPLDLTPYKELDERYQLGYETMRDVVEVAEYVIESEDGAPEFSWLAGRAAFLKPLPGRTTLKERCAIVEQMSTDDLAMLEAYSQDITDYGVSEFANIRCKECGASTRVNISFDALTFLQLR